jgi:hypothetical protein
MSESKHDGEAERAGAWMETPEFLELKRHAHLKRNPPPNEPPPHRKPGSLKGKIWISPDFDEADEEIIRLFGGEG